MKLSKKQLLFNIKAHLSGIDEVYQAFISGSTSLGKESVFSDIDLWIVFREESGLKSYLNNLGQLLPYTFIIEVIENCTPTHFFIHLEDGWQIDLNLTTAAEYHSLTSQNKLIIINRLPSSISQRDIAQATFLVKGIGLLERTFSKFETKKYAQVARFSMAVRDQFIIPLLAANDVVRPNSIAEFDITQLNPILKKIINLLYPKPSHRETKRFLLLSLLLVKKYGYKQMKKEHRLRIVAMLKKITEKE
jgi:predicted nucleotidyltransferase